MWRAICAWLIQVKDIQDCLTNNTSIDSPFASGRVFSMGNLTVRKRIRHHWSDLFGLVADLESYPKFVPCCQATKVLARTGDGTGTTAIMSRMTVGVSALHVSYANRTLADLRERRITVESVDGPLRHLRAVWEFTPDGDEWTNVSFTVSYEFSSPMLAVLASGIFESMFRQILDAFEQRADKQFRRPAARAAPTRKAEIALAPSA
jgi:coenzyme Q-binding protein COQ10